MKDNNTDIIKKFDSCVLICAVGGIMLHKHMMGKYNWTRKQYNGNLKLYYEYTITKTINNIDWKEIEMI